MKVTMNTAMGDLTFEVNSLEDFALLRTISELPRNGNGVHHVETVEAEPLPPPADDVVERAAGMGLSVSLYSAWEYLVQHESRRGGTSPSQQRHGCKLSTRKGMRGDSTGVVTLRALRNN